MKIWLVTGTSRGLGRHLVEEVLARGDKVIATARDPACHDDLKAKYVDRIRTAELDVRDPEAARAAVELAVAEFSHLDVVVNNAGQADFGAFEDTPQESVKRQLDTVFGGVVNVTKAALPILRRQGCGHIIQISSMGARMGTPGLAVYQGAKAAVTTFSLALAEEVAPLGITVTIVEPGSLRTEITSAASMTTLPMSEPYRAALGALADRLHDCDGQQPGDPVKTAAAIVDLAHASQPPLRIPLGSDAVRFARIAAERLAAADHDTRALSASIDFNEDDRGTCETINR